jgi:3-deoxy-D-manno-octulosonic-acid transferase
VLLVSLVLPFVVAGDVWKELRGVAPRGRWRQRCGSIAPARAAGCIWIHAVSVGEVQAASGLVHAVRVRMPEAPVVVTTVTATGAETVRTVLGTNVEHRYLPYDSPGAVRRFLSALQPAVAVIVETEIWPALFFALQARGIPIVLASARLSERSVRRYAQFGDLGRRLLGHGVAICAQTATDAERFVAAGAARASVRVTGNMKFDLQIPAATIADGRERRAQWSRGRVWIAGSTRDGEEAIVLDAHRTLGERDAATLLILVPRHPARFAEVRGLLRQRGVRHVARSEGGWPRSDDEVLLVDTLGELQMLYAAADVAFVGGSLVPVGGHSLLEPASLGLPVLAGPHLANTLEAATQLREAGALQIVRDAAELAHAAGRLLDDPAARTRAGEAGRQVIEANRGAVERVLAVVEPAIRASSPTPASAPPGSAAS